MESAKKRRIADEKRQFKESWTILLLKKNEKIISDMKEYNIKRHFETYHEVYIAYVGEERKHKAAKLRTGLSAQQAIFKKVSRINEASTEACYIVAHEIAKKCKLFSDGEFIKDCIMKVVDKVCPEKRNAFKEVKL